MSPPSQVAASASLTGKLYGSNKSSSHNTTTKPTRLSLHGRLVLSQCFDSGCHFPSRDKKDALLRAVQKTDPEYSLAKLNVWFSNHRREQRKGHKETTEDALLTLLDPTTSLAQEMWPSLSADTLARLHNMLLEQPHLTIQHVELLANHFSVDNKHMENFIEWRGACLQGCDVDVGQEHRRPLPPSASGNDVFNVDEADVHLRRAHLPTPACSTSPEPLRCKSPPLFAYNHRPHHLPSVDTNHVASSGQGVVFPPSPASTISPHFPLQGSSNISPTHANSCGPHSPESPRVKHLPTTSPHERLFSVKPTQLSSTAPSNPSEVLTEASLSRLRGRKQIGSGAPITSLTGRLPESLSIPRTLREFEEAYAPTYTRIERFLHNVERGKFVHIGLTPDMLKKAEI